MKKTILILTALMLLHSQCFGIVDWIRGDGTDAVKGTDNASDIDYDITNYIQDPLDKLLSDYVYGCNLAYATASTITVGVGEVTCQNGAGTIKRMRKNTAAYTLDMTVVGVGGIDSGSAEAASTWYDVYAVADANATTFTCIIGAHGTALSDVTYYNLIGRFYNDSSQNIRNWTVENSEGETGLGSWTSTDIDGVALATGSSYLANTDGFVVVNGDLNVSIFTDAANPPTVERYGSTLNAGQSNSGICIVRKGDYWKVTASSSTIYWVPLLHIKK